MKTLKIFIPSIICFCIFLLAAPASIFAGDYDSLAALKNVLGSSRLTSEISKSVDVISKHLNQDKAVQDSAADKITGSVDKLDEINENLESDDAADKISESIEEMNKISMDDSINKLLAICPTHDEKIQIRKDFMISYDKEVFDEPYAVTCTDYGDESDVMLSTYNVFRAFKFIKFKKPMPPIDQTNLYDWLKSINIEIYIFSGGGSFGDGSSTGGGNLISLNSEGFSLKTNRKWYDAETGLGLMHLAALILHEARHTVPGGGYMHTACSPYDSEPYGKDKNLAYDGAWAMNYYFFDWISKDNSGQFDQEIKEAAAINANIVLNERFCE